jgi:hypothetical protein
MSDYKKNNPFRAHPILIQMLSKTILGASDELCQLLEIVETGKDLNKLGKLPPLSAWMQYYHSSRKFRRDFERVLGFGDGTFFQDMLDETTRVQRLSPEERIQEISRQWQDPEVQAGVRKLTAVLHAENNALDDELAGNLTITPEEDKELDDFSPLQWDNSLSASGSPV